MKLINLGQLVSLIAAFILGFLLADGFADYLPMLAVSCMALAVGYFVGLFEQQRTATPPSGAAVTARSLGQKDSAIL
jgi:hypothetical protein